MSIRAVLFSVCVVIAGCGGPSRGASEAPELLTLSETRALELITDVLNEETIAPGGEWAVSLSSEVELDVDVRLGNSNFGIEWISPQDREDVGDAVPQPAPGGQLRIVPGYGEDEGAQILVLEHSAFEYANEREAVQSGVPGAHDTENRLRRDIRDFLDYVRGQGGL